jgi:hypothetical protein
VVHTKHNGKLYSAQLILAHDWEMDASIADNLEFFGGSNQWNVSFVRAAHDCEIQGGGWLQDQILAR